MVVKILIEHLFYYKDHTIVVFYGLMHYSILIHYMVPEMHSFLEANTIILVILYTQIKLLKYLIIDIHTKIASTKYW